MNKLTLDDLRRQYSDRPQPAEVEKLKPEPISIEPEVPNVLSITPEVTTARMSTTPLVGFLVFAGIAMFAGFAVLVNIDLNNDAPTQNVLGVKDVQSTLENRNVNKENVAPEDTDIVPVVNRIHDLMISDEIEEEEQSPVVIVEENVSNVSEEEILEDDSSADSVVEETTIVRVRDVEGGYVNLRRDPLLNPFSRAASGTEFEMVSEVSLGEYTWVEVKYDEDTNCWIRADLIEKL